MATEHVERPIFAEGQYLGAADLTAAVDHGRVHAARHLLAAHTWGIALGLDLEERTIPATGELEVFLRPGYAWDGFGRPVVVLAPCRIPATAFRTATCPAIGGGANGCPIDVWLRYREEATSGPRPGFEDCNGDGRFGRVRETFAIEIGPRSATSQQDPIDVGGQPRPARDALKVHDPALTLHDESVPYQTLPVPASATWLIPVGQVRWQPVAGGQPGRFVARTAADLAASAAARRYVGVVAEGLQAAGESLRLRKRTVAPRTEPSDDLVWVEGDLRAHGHARLWGGKLEFREPDGRGSGNATDPIAPLRLQATPAGAGAARTLQIAIGPDSAADNALAIGPLLAGNPDAIVARVVVRSGGNVGIGTSAPAHLLHVRKDDTSATQVLVENRSGGANAGTRVVARETNDRAVELGFIGSGNAPFRNLVPNTAYVAALQGAAALAFNHQGTGPITFHTDDWNERMRITAVGRVGIGTTAPTDRLHIDGGSLRVSGGEIAWANSRLTGDYGGSIELGGTAAIAGTGTPYIDFHFNRPVTEDFNVRIINDADGRLTLNAQIVRATGQLGIGTTAPRAPLEVNGTVRLGLNGIFFAAAGDVDLRLIRGTVDVDGVRVDGEGFKIEVLGQGRYRINLDNSFPSRPSVVVSQVYPNGEDVGPFDNVGDPGDSFIITGVGNDGFVLVVTGDIFGLRPDREFSFIVAGPR